MKAKATVTKPDEPRRWKALSQAQLNAIELLLSGYDDTATAAHPTVNAARQTVWEWRTVHVIFRAELQQRRAALWSSTFEKLRGLMGKAVANITGAIEAGDVAASWNLLKCIGLYGNGSGNGVAGAHIELVLEHLAEERAAKEYEAMDPNTRIMADLMDDWRGHRRIEILHELLEAHREPAT